MNVRLARLESRPEDSLRVLQQNRRREARYATWFNAAIESSGGDTAEVLLADVSHHGCSIKTDASWLRTGAFISIGIDKAPKLTAIVRWVRDGSAGMEFLRPIPAERAEWHELMELSF